MWILALAGAGLILVLVLHLARKAVVFLLALVALIVAGVFSYALAAQATATRQVAQVAQAQAVISAATTLTLFLLILLIFLVLALLAGAIVLRWWQKYQEQQRVAEIMKMLQVQAMLNMNKPGVFTGTSAPGAQGAQIPPTPITIQLLPYWGNYLPPAVPPADEQLWEW